MLDRLFDLLPRQLLLEVRRQEIVQRGPLPRPLVLLGALEQVRHRLRVRWERRAGRGRRTRLAVAPALEPARHEVPHEGIEALVVREDDELRLRGLADPLAQVTGDVEVEGVAAVAVDGDPGEARAQRLRLLDERRRELRLRLADEDLDARVGRRLAEVEAVDVLQVHQQELLVHSYCLRPLGSPNVPESPVRL